MTLYLRDGLHVVFQVAATELQHLEFSIIEPVLADSAGLEPVVGQVAPYLIVL